MDVFTPRLTGSGRLALSVAAGAAVLGLSVVHLLTGAGGDTFAAWYQPAVFMLCGLVVAARVAWRSSERPAWALLATGLLLYGAGSVVFNLAFSDGEPAPFPSVADGLWLCLYPCAFAGIVLLAKRRFARVTSVLWLDGVICGGVVAAIVAAVLFEPIFDVTVANGAASAARLAYPVGDLLGVGLVVAVWTLSGRRFEPFWLLIGAGLALLTFGDSFYVVEAANGTWAPGNWLDLPYALATMLLAAAAWAAPRDVHVLPDPETGRFMLPVVFAVLALVVLGAAEVLGLNALAIGLSNLTVVAMVARFACTLGWLDRQRTRLAELAATDPLTGVANHRTLHQRLGQEVERARRSGLPLAVVALDVDHFKTINDTFGHAEGDVALQAIARVLSATVRPFDLVARVGGEEFALVLPGADGARAGEIAERCRRALLGVDLQGTRINCSAGVAAFPEDDTDGRRLLELADGALYAAKQGGRAQVRRYDPRTMVLLSSAEQHRQVRSVLERPDAIASVVQPIVELATGRVAGYEALTRFPGVEPVRSPDLWFAQARRCGLGNQLEALAIERALAIEGRPPGTFLTVNVSPTGLLSPEVQAVLPRDLTDVVVELTEDELFGTDDVLDHTLADLRARGARIAVDDAGAGYAGLPQLIRVRPDILKLDRELIREVHRDGAKTALLDALARFASSTGAAVCAEGIEEADELRALARLDVTYAQGYALGRPGEPWPGVNDAVVGVATAPTHAGLRLAGFDRCPDAVPSAGDVADVLSRVDSAAALDAAVPALVAFGCADELAISVLSCDGEFIQTLSTDTGSPTGERFALRDWPTTRRVIEEQIVGQIVVGDGAADDAELAFLAQNGSGAVLMLLIVHRARTIGLLELYRDAPRPWTSGDIDQVRMLAPQLAAVIATLGVAEQHALS